MNKALHAFVYLFLILAGASLWFELQLQSQREVLTDRDRIQRDYIIKLAATIEDASKPGEDDTREVVEVLKMDESPLDISSDEDPSTKDLLESVQYDEQYEKGGFKTFDWRSDAVKTKLKAVYLVDAEGKPMVEDGSKVMSTGNGNTTTDMLDSLFKASGEQLAKLNSTRAELPKLRKALNMAIKEVNAVKPVARKRLEEMNNRDAEIAKLNGEKAELQSQVTKIKAQIGELESEIISKSEQIQLAQEEIAKKDEDIQTYKDRNELLTKQLREARALNQGAGSVGTTMAGGTTQVSFGEKGKIIRTENEFGFVVVELSSAALDELKGTKRDKPIFQGTELLVKRFAGPEDKVGSIIGRVKFRQEVPGKNYVVVYIDTFIQQGTLEVGDFVFSD